jgi:flagellar assembly protein FliH
MSCKILAGGNDRLAKPLLWRQLGATPATTGAAPLSSGTPAEGREGADVDKLHGRVVELERALESAVRQARERAYQEGLAAGRESAAAEMKPAMERLLRSCTDVIGLRARIRKETESDLVTLTVAIARRVLRRELSVDPEAIHGVVKAALAKLQSKEISVIHTSPDHVEAIRGYFEKAGLSASVETVADPALEVGGVVLETRRGNLDASVETQLKEIERGFADRLGR